MAKTKKKPKKNPAAVMLGRRGGKNSRANMTKKEASELARKAINARWAAYYKKKKQAKRKNAEASAVIPTARKRRS